MFGSSGTDTTAVSDSQLTFETNANSNRQCGALFEWIDKQNFKDNDDVFR